MNSFLDWLDTIDSTKDVAIFAALHDYTDDLQRKFEPISSLLYAPLLVVCDAFQKPLSEVIFLFAAVLTIVACLVLPYIRNITQRRLYSFTTGFMIGLFTYGVPYLFRIVYVMLGYVQLRFLPRKTSAKSVPVIAMALLTARTLY